MSHAQNNQVINEILQQLMDVPCDLDNREFGVAILNPLTPLNHPAWIEVGQRIAKHGIAIPVGPSDRGVNWDGRA
jgi:hypothetical protein